MESKRKKPSLEKARALVGKIKTLLTPYERDPHHLPSKQTVDTLKALDAELGETKNRVHGLYKALNARFRMKQVLLPDAE